MATIKAGSIVYTVEPRPNAPNHQAESIAINNDQALEDVQDLLVGMGFFVLNVLILALSLLLLAPLAFLAAWICSPESRFQRKAPPNSRLLGWLGIISGLHCLVVVLGYFVVLPAVGDRAWWWVVLASVLVFYALALGIGIAGGIMFGFVRVVSGRAKAKTGEEYLPVAHDEVELETVEEGEEPPPYEEGKV